MIAYRETVIWSFIKFSQIREGVHEFDADTHKTLILGEDFDEEEDRKDEGSYGKDSYNNRYLSPNYMQL